MKKRTDFSWESDPTVYLAVYSEPSEGEKRPVVLMLPGGGYEVCADVEAAPAAERFAAMGYGAFLLHYSAKYRSLGRREQEPNPHTRFPEPLLEVGAAMQYIASHEEEWGLDAERIILAGFSAGGHLACCYMNLWQELKLPKPVLCIPVYAAVDLPAQSLMMTGVFAGDEPDEAELARYTPADTVGPQTPPCFIVHSVTDPIVPVRQSVGLAQALDAAGVPYELHLFGCGAHAYGAGEGQRVGVWPELADSFIRHILANPQSYDKAYVKENFSF